PGVVRGGRGIPSTDVDTEPARRRSRPTAQAGADTGGAGREPARRRVPTRGGPGGAWRRRVGSSPTRRPTRPPTSLHRGAGRGSDVWPVRRRSKRSPVEYAIPVI